MTRNNLTDSPADAPPTAEIKRIRHSVKNIEPGTFDWLNDNTHPVRGEIALWAAVVTQLMMDALSRCHTSEARHYKQEAIHWLTGNSLSFIMVCHYANLDPDYVRINAKRAMMNPQGWRAQPGKGKRYFECKAYRINPRKKPTDTTVATPAKQAKGALYGKK